jgi:lipopolysaccharide/colanic/teichoic acid biosynthesis glycosyltransferase
MIVWARFLTYTGIAGAVVGLSLLHASRNGYDYAGSSRFGFSMAFIALLALTAYGLGIPDLVLSRRRALLAAAQATIIAALGVSLLQLFLGDKLLPRFVVLGSPLVLIPWLTLCGVLAARGSRTAADRARLYVIATDDNCKALLEDLDREAERPAKLVGSITPERAKELALSGTLEEAVRAARATVLVLDRAALLDEEVVSQCGQLHERGLRTRTLVTFYEEWLGKLPISELERASLMFDIGEIHRVRYWRVKRVADVLVALIGLVFLAVVLPFVYAGNLLTGNRRILYKQLRVGKNAREFWIYKFRTMPANPTAELTHWTALDDPRISPFGRILRRSHLDELPQVMNILRGELSLIGPRPEQPQYVEALSKVLPYYRLRYLVTPGLTGWAQVKFGYAGTEADALEKLQYDFYYLSNQGLRLDLLIVGRTIRNIAGLRGR